jgi:hypothetical protein
MGNAQRFLSRRLERLQPNLNERLYFQPVAGAVGADGFLPDFWKKQWIVSCALRTFGAASSWGEEGLILRVKGGVREVQMDFGFNPLAKFPHGCYCFGFLVFQKGCRRSVIREASGESALLVCRLEPRNFKCVRDRQFACVEGVLDFFDKMHQAQSRIDIFLGTPDFLGKRFDRVGVGLQVHEGRIAPRFVEFVHVGALQVFDELQFKAFRVGEFSDRGRDGFPLGYPRSSVAPCSGHKFKETVLSVRQWSNENGLQDAMLTDVAGEFRQLRFVKRASWIGFRFLNAIEWNVPKGGHPCRNGIARVYCDCGIHFCFLLFFLN